MAAALSIASYDEADSTAIRYTKVKAIQAGLSSLWSAPQEIEFQQAAASSPQPLTLAAIPPARTAFLSHFSTGVQQQIARIFAIPQDEAVADWTESLKGDLDLYEFTVRYVNDLLIDWLLQSPDIDEASVREVLAMIVDIQSHNAITKYPGEAPIHTLRPGEIFRANGEDVWAGNSEVVLPFVSGEFVSPAMDALLTKIETEFKDLSLEQAITKACVYFSMMIVIHPQKDFNKRTYRRFFNYLIARSTRNAASHTSSKQSTKTPFDSLDSHFTDKNLIPARHEIREELFLHYFPELAGSRALLSAFIKYFFPKIFSHSVNPAEQVEAIMISADIGQISLGGEVSADWHFEPPAGVTESEVDYFLLIHPEAKIFDRADLYARLKTLEGVDSQNHYHEDVIAVGEKIRIELCPQKYPNFTRMIKNTRAKCTF